MIHIPFVFFPLPILQRISDKMLVVGEFLRRMFPSLKIDLEAAEMRLSDKEYISICLASDLLLSVLLFVIFLMAFSKYVGQFILVSFILAFVLILFVFLIQVGYPHSVVFKRIQKVDSNLLPAMQNLLVQLNSGIPIFDVLVNLSKGDYGALSEEIAKAVREINAGIPEVDALEGMAKRNPSPIFRGAMWQIVNGMKTGADIAVVIQEVINVLSDQQALQIQRYGTTLNPLAMFYMLLAMISSLINFGDTLTKIAFWVLFIVVVLTQFMFINLIRSKRPSLLGG